MLTALDLTEKLLALAIALQTLELFRIRALFSDVGVWKWSSLRKEFSFLPFPLRAFFDLLLAYRPFLIVLGFRLLACFWILALPYGDRSLPAWPSAFLFLSTWLIALRWRGTFNGGSDSMTAVISLGVWIAQAFREHELIVLASLGFIAIHAVLSYFIAGLVKLKNPDWRKGRVLTGFFETPGYDSQDEWIKRLLNQRLIALLSAWIVILFECLFPFALVDPTLCITFLLTAFVFHVLNFWIFGLNRFVFIWIAAYPALFYWSQR